MGKIFGKTIREKYIESLVKDGKIDDAKKVAAKKCNEPITEDTYVSNNSEIKVDEVNYMISNMATDINIVHNEICQSANALNNLINSTVIKFNGIEKILNTEKERLEDMNMLCNKHTGFKGLIALNDKQIKTDCSIEDNVYSLKKREVVNVKPEILAISGNGFEGNKYIYNDDKFQNEINNTGNREYINDTSQLTYYEYSRITASNSETINNDINFDSIKARCSILIKGATSFNVLELKTGTKDLKLEELLISSDGQTFNKVGLYDIAICNKRDRFDKKNYIYGSGILSFPSTQYIKLILKASSNTDDAIAIKSVNDVGEEEVVKLKTAKRSVIRINDIKTSKQNYNLNSQIFLDNFITDNVKSIAIFANEYILNDESIRDSIKYTLTINGIDYDIVPINSQYNGKKIIRTTSETIPADYVHYVNETIKSATLTINMVTSNSLVTPYLSNVKILLGDE